MNLQFCLVIFLYILTPGEVQSDDLEKLLVEKALALNIQHFFKDPVLIQDVEADSVVFKLPMEALDEEAAPVYKQKSQKDTNMDIVVFNNDAATKNVYTVLRKNILATRSTYYATYAYLRNATKFDPPGEIIDVDNKRLFVEWDTWADRSSKSSQLQHWTSCESTIFLTCGMDSSSQAVQKSVSVPLKTDGKEVMAKSDNDNYLFFNDLDYKSLRIKGGRGFNRPKKIVINVKTNLHPLYQQQPPSFMPVYAIPPMAYIPPMVMTYIQQMIPIVPVYPAVPVVYPSFQPIGLIPIYIVPPFLMWISYHISGNYIPDDTRIRPIHGFLTPNPAGNPTSFIPDNPSLALFLPSNVGTTGVFIPDGYALGANCHGALLPSIYPGQPFLFVPNSLGFPGWFFPDNGAPRFHGFQIPGQAGFPSSFIPDPSAFDLNPNLRFYPVSGVFQSDMPAGGGLIAGAGNIRAHGTLVPSYNSFGSPHVFIMDYLGTPGFFRPDNVNVPPISGFYLPGTSGSPPNFIPCDNRIGLPNMTQPGTFIPSNTDKASLPTDVDNIRGQVMFGKPKDKGFIPLVPEDNGDLGTFIPENKQIRPVRGYHIPSSGDTPGVFINIDPVDPNIKGLTPGYFKADAPEDNGDSNDVDGFLFKTPNKYLIIPKGLGNPGNFYPSNVKQPVPGTLVIGPQHLFYFYPEKPFTKSGTWFGTFKPDPPKISGPGGPPSTGPGGPPSTGPGGYGGYPTGGLPEYAKPPPPGPGAYPPVGPGAYGKPPPAGPGSYSNLPPPGPGAYPPVGPGGYPPSGPGGYPPSGPGGYPPSGPGGYPPSGPGGYPPSGPGGYPQPGPAGYPPSGPGGYPQPGPGGYPQPGPGGYPQPGPGGYPPSGPGSYPQTGPGAYPPVAPGGYGKYPPAGPGSYPNLPPPGPGAYPPVAPGGYGKYPPAGPGAYPNLPPPGPGAYPPVGPGGYPENPGYPSAGTPGGYPGSSGYGGYPQGNPQTPSKWGALPPAGAPQGKPVQGYLLGVANSQEPYKFIVNGNVYAGMFTPDENNNKPIRGFFVTGTLGSPGKFIPDPESPVEIFKPTKGTFQPENQQYPKILCSLMPSKKGQPPRFIPEEDSVPGKFTPDNKPNWSIHGTLVLNKEKEYPASFLPDDPDCFRANFPHQTQPGQFEPDGSAEPLRGNLVPNMIGQSPIFIIDPAGVPGIFFPSGHSNFSMTGVLIPPKDQDNPGQLYLDDDRFIGTFQPFETTKGIFNPDKYRSGYPVKGVYTPQNPGKAPTFQILLNDGGFPGSFYPDKYPAVKGVYFPAKGSKLSKFFPTSPFNPIPPSTSTLPGKFVPDNLNGATVDGKVKIPPNPGYPFLLKTSANPKLPNTQKQNLPQQQQPEPQPTAPQKISNPKAGQPAWWYPSSNPRNRVHGLFVTPDKPNAPVQFFPDEPTDFKSVPMESLGSFVLDPPNDRTPIPGTLSVPESYKEPCTFTSETSKPTSPKPSPPAPPGSTSSKTPPPKTVTPTTPNAKFFPDDVPGNKISGIFNPRTNEFTPEDPKDMTDKLGKKPTPGIMIMDDVDSSVPTAGTLNPPSKPGQPAKFVPKTFESPKASKPVGSFLPDSTPLKSIKGTFLPDLNTFTPKTPNQVTRPMIGKMVPPDADPIRGTLYPPKSPSEPCFFIPSSDDQTDPNGQSFFYPDSAPGNPIIGKFDPDKKAFIPDDPQSAAKRVKQPSPGRIVKDSSTQPIPGKLLPQKSPDQPFMFVEIRPGGQSCSFISDTTQGSIKGTYYPPSSGTGDEFIPDDPSEVVPGNGKIVLDPPFDQKPIPGSIKKDGPGNGLKFTPKSKPPASKKDTPVPATFYLDKNPYFPMRGLYSKNGHPQTFIPDDPVNAQAGPGKMVMDPPEDPNPISGDITKDPDSSKPLTFAPVSEKGPTASAPPLGNPKHPSGGTTVTFFPDSNPKNKIHGTYFPPNTFYPDDDLTDTTPQSGVFISDTPEDRTPTFGTLSPSGSDQPASFQPNDNSKPPEAEDESSFVPDVSAPSQKPTKQTCWFYPEHDSRSKVKGTFTPPNYFLPDNPDEAPPSDGPTPGLIVPDNGIPIFGKLYPAPKPGMPLPFKPELKKEKVKILNGVTSYPVAEEPTPPPRNPSAPIDSSINMQMPPGIVNGFFFGIKGGKPLFIPFGGTTGFFVLDNGQKIHGSFYPFEQPDPSSFVPDSLSDLAYSGSGLFYPDVASYLITDQARPFLNRLSIPGTITMSYPSFLFTATFKLPKAGYWHPNPPTGCFVYNPKGYLVVYNEEKLKASRTPVQSKGQKGSFFNGTESESLFVPESGIDGQFVSDFGLTINGLLSPTLYPTICNFQPDDPLSPKIGEQTNGMFKLQYSGYIRGTLKVSGATVTFKTDVAGVKGTYIKGTEDQTSFTVCCTQEKPKSQGRALAIDTKKNGLSKSNVLSKPADITSGWKTQSSKISPNETLKFETEKFYGMGNCPFKQVELSEVENDRDVIHFYTTVLRTQCVPETKERIQRLITERVLSIKNKVFVLEKHLIFNQSKLTVEQFSDLTVAFELSVFSQTYKDHENPSETAEISRSAEFIVKMGLKAIQDALENVQTHVTHLKRSIILTINTAFRKLCQDSKALLECTDCKTDELINYNDKVHLMSFVQFLLHGESTSSFEEFVKSNLDFVKWKVDVGCNL